MNFIKRFFFLRPNSEPPVALMFADIRRRIAGGEKRVRISRDEMATLCEYLDERQLMIAEQNGGIRLDGATIYSERFA